MTNEGPIEPDLHPSPEASGEIVRTVEVAQSTWRDVTAALSPIIGQPDVNALFKRSLQLRFAEYSALTNAGLTADQSDGFVAGLGAALLKLAPETASAANAAVLSAFVDLLSNLIGAALTAHLIGFAYHPPSGGDPARDS